MINLTYSNKKTYEDNRHRTVMTEIYIQSSLLTLKLNHIKIFVSTRVTLQADPHTQLSICVYTRMTTIEKKII